MTSSLPPVYFYLCKEYWFNRLPQTIEEYWSWQVSNCDDRDYWGVWNWTLQTYLWLKRSGFPCELTDSMPSEGIVVAHMEF